ncbi:MAG: TfoX/Sxy family protein [Saprospiraceae bacterium]|uniref:TfoX/Sxy family protein n=1 Tax=Candidatus Opimibacter skivensis TaxID=2982028 RepID=A0A9D7SV52_9BACT|nr:TfoX/Sxy family protein [Candidatus Opimibacter skivensis]
MPLDEALSDRIRQILDARKVRFTEKKMFGGLCFMVDDKMLMGAREGRIMVRIDPEEEAKSLKIKGARPMDFTGRSMKGYLFVDEKGFDLDEDLEYWVSLCLKFNPKAKSSRKKG